MVSIYLKLLVEGEKFFDKSSTLGKKCLRKDLSVVVRFGSYSRLWEYDTNLNLRAVRMHGAGTEKPGSGV